ncbi:GNAT family N-acetyltransferase [Amycolatopsis roodepoortensis]|uniref:GNAT family N-acetyltransferase n=1 Tax=Amycolatopsis roodepoortensis TaxID=700274 RepID=UPI00214B3B70|nr:GNAT family N-acetyltransferase [Amycolatopsis roodepoortensis]UUV32511.1 GNAT family N-acetyltransferase [Amycolatopsis roodepoortensis]
MSEFHVRAVAEGEQRACLDVLSQSLHGKPASDEVWAKMAPSWPAAGKFAAFDDHGTPVGITSSFEVELTVPGGQRLVTAAVDGVGVRADWTRRGILTSMMAAQLEDLAARGVPLAALHASEAVIYGRFGYGAATFCRGVSVERPRAQLRDGVGREGVVRFVTPAEAVERVPALYNRFEGTRPGFVSRPACWWPGFFDRVVTGDDGYRVAVHSGPDGDDGFVVYQTIDTRDRQAPERGALLDIRELHAATPQAWAGLWRFLLSIDLVSAVAGRGRPLDEPLAELLTDPRAVNTTEVIDDLWLRLVDVLAALRARSYGTAEPVVLEVHDKQLPGNDGRYVVGPDGVDRTTAEADLRLDVDTLASLYLGHGLFGDLALSGRVEVLDEAAVARADALFHTARTPWCGTFF